jgi:hypothetical protein
MNKYLVIYLLLVQPIVMMGMHRPLELLANTGKKRESVSRVRVMALRNSQSPRSDQSPCISHSGCITYSGEYLIREQDTEPNAVRFRLSSSSLSDQGCSPSKEVTSFLMDQELSVLIPMVIDGK